MEKHQSIFMEKSMLRPKLPNQCNWLISDIIFYNYWNYIDIFEKIISLLILFIHVY